jgi:hypothetical protein
VSVCSSEPAFTQYSLALFTSKRFGQLRVAVQRASRPSTRPVIGSAVVWCANGNGASGYRWFCRLRSVRPGCAKR